MYTQRPRLCLSSLRDVAGKEKTGVLTEGIKSSLKHLSSTGTVIGAIAGGGPALYNILTKKDGWKNWDNIIDLAIAGFAVVAETTGLGEAYDGTIGLGIALGTIAYDITKTVKSK